MAYLDPDIAAFQAAGEMNARKQQIENQRLQQLAQQRYNEERIRLEEEERAEILKEKERQRYEKFQADNLMKAAYDKIYGQDLIKQGISGERAIGERTKQVGIEMLRTNPSAGMKLIEQGNEQLKKSADAEQEVLQTEVARKEYAARILTNVGDEQGWEFAKTGLAKMGIPIPQQFMQYNDNTKKWIASQVVGSKSALDAEKLELKKQELTAKEESFRLKQDLAERKEDRISRNQALAQERYERSYRTGKPAAPKETQAIVKVLSGNEKFDDLPSETKIEAAKELDYIARDIMVQRPGTSFEVARDEAKQLIYDSIDENGTYRSFASRGASSAQGAVVTPTSMEEFKALPKGSRYINPKDGKTYIKK